MLVGWAMVRGSMGRVTLTGRGAQVGGLWLSARGAGDIPWGSGDAGPLEGLVWHLWGQPHPPIQLLG